MPGQLDTIVDPAWRSNPPVKINVSAKSLGLVVAILAGIETLLALITLLQFVGVAAFGGIFAAALLGEVAVVASGGFVTYGGWQMYNDNLAGKRLAIYGFLLYAIAQIVFIVGYAGYAFGGVVGYALVPLIIDGILYYLVVISRAPGEAPLV